MKRKLLIVSTWYPSEQIPHNGIFVQNQAQFLSKIYDVRVVVPGTFGVRGLLQRVQYLSAPEQRAGLTVQRENGFAPIPYHFLTHLYAAERAMRRGFARVGKTWGKPDLIHAHVIFPAGWIAIKLGQQFGIPVVLTEHSSPFEMHLRQPSQRRLARIVLRQAQRVLAVSPALAARIDCFEPKAKVAILGNVIKTDIFTIGQQNGPQGAPIRFLSISGLVPRKGVKYLIDAAAILVSRGIQAFQILIGGDGPERMQLEQQARTRGLADKCRFLGWLGQNQVLVHMQHCTAYVLPSLEETFGMVVGEAMACGKPVIATRCGGPEYILTPETGLLVEPANPVALADAMQSLIEGRVQYDSQAIRSSIVQRFGPDVFVERINSIYEAIWQYC